MADNPYAPSALPGATPATAIPSVSAFSPSALPGAAPAAAATSIPISRSAVWTGAYAPSEIHTALVKAGVPPSVAPTLTAISGAESGFGKSTVSGVNKNGSRDYGVFQVNDKAWPQFGGADVAKLPLDQQAKLAAEIYRKQGLSAWSTYNNGAYKSHLNGASPATSGAPPPGGAAPGVATTAAKPSFADAAQKGDVGAMLQALTAEDAKGKSPLGSLGDNLSQNAGGSARSGGAQASIPMAYPAPQADYAGPAGQLMAQVTQLQNKPLSWSAAPFGSGAGMVPGTTLNS